MDGLLGELMKLQAIVTELKMAQNLNFADAFARLDKLEAGANQQRVDKEQDERKAQAELRRRAESAEAELTRLRGAASADSVATHIANGGKR